MIHCLAPADCCSQMGALPTTTANCHLWTLIAWPTHAAFPSPYSPAPPPVPRSVRDRGQLPARHGHGGNSQDSHESTACIQTGRSFPADILQVSGMPVIHPHLLPVCQQLTGWLLWDGSRAPGRKSHTSRSAALEVPLHPSVTLEEWRALDCRKSRVLRPEIPFAFSNPLLFTIRK